MHGFKNTECKIIGCKNPVWPNKTLGFCSKHYQRFEHGRMAKNGDLLPLPTKTKKCESCGRLFELKKMERHVKWCPFCREKEYKQIQTENNCGIYRRGHNCKSENVWKKKYISSVLNITIKTIESSKKYGPILLMREAGKTYSEIAEIVGCSKQNIQYLCKKYLSNNRVVQTGASEAIPPEQSARTAHP